MINRNPQSVVLAQNHSPWPPSKTLSVATGVRRLLKSRFGFVTRRRGRNLSLATLGALLLLARSAFPLGANVPFTDVEAESMTLGGGARVVNATLPPTNQYSTPALEASQRSYVQLTATGQYLQWTNNTGRTINALNVRFCIPDAPAGGGISNTLDLYVNGNFRQALPVTSFHTYFYEGANYENKNDKNPADGDPFDFWDDMHTFITGAAVAPGDTVRFQKDSMNSAAFYYIDVVDFEAVPPPLTQPTNSLSITSYGAVSNNPAYDNTADITSCFRAAVSQGKTVWIPPGTFYIAPTNHGINNVTGVSVIGAGPWYSTIYRVAPPSTNGPVGGIFNDSTLSLQGICLDTGSMIPNNFAFHTYGTNWVIDNVWIQHLDTAVWCGGVGGIVKNCRILSVLGDGGNLNNVTDPHGIGMDLMYSNNFVRGTGDDAMAINSVYNNGTNYYTIMSNITYANNTACCTWKGHDLGLYGGVNVIVTGNLLRDDARSRGLAVGRFGANGSGTFSATVTWNTLWRDGGNVFGQQQEAFAIGSNPPGETSGNIYCASNTIYDSLYNAVSFTTATNVVFQRNTIVNPALNGMIVPPGGEGIGIVNANTVTGLKSGYFDITNQATDYAVVIPIEASDFDGSKGVDTQACSEGGLNVDFITNGTYTAYNSVDLANVNHFVARVASYSSGGNIQIREDSATGTLLGICTVPGTGGWQNWTNVYCSLSGAIGTHNIYLVYTGGSGSLFNIEFFGLYTEPATLP